MWEGGWRLRPQSHGQMPSALVRSHWGHKRALLMEWGVAA